MERKAIVAGQFYPSDRDELNQAVLGYIGDRRDTRDAIAIISPHAGYIYSGPVTGKVFAAASIPKRAIVLCPNHSGRGARAAIMARGAWTIPTGSIEIDESIANSLLELSPTLKEDASAHENEHSLEVLLPFLIAREPELLLTPISISRLNFEECRKLGMAIAQVIKQTSERIIIVASSDMNHYEDQESTVRKDRMAIAQIEELNADGLLEVCAKNRITMCGAIPAAIALIAAKELGAKKAELIDYRTSGDVSGDYSQVVGYAGFVIRR